MADDNTEYLVLNGTAKLVVNAKGTSKLVMNEGEAPPRKMKLKQKLGTRKG